MGATLDAAFVSCTLPHRARLIFQWVESSDFSGCSSVHASRIVQFFEPIIIWVNKYLGGIVIIEFVNPFMNSAAQICLRTESPAVFPKHSNQCCKSYVFACAVQRQQKNRMVMIMLIWDACKWHLFRESLHLAKSFSCMTNDIPLSIDIFTLTNKLGLIKK